VQDIGILMEGETDDELPEVMLGATRLAKGQLDSAPVLMD
jgi:hypothetical protein